MQMAIVVAKEAGMDRIIHLDTDELLHPTGTMEYSLRQLLSDVPNNVDMVVFPNYDGRVERDDMKEPFAEASGDNYKPSILWRVGRTAGRPLNKSNLGIHNQTE